MSPTVNQTNKLVLGKESSTATAPRRRRSLGIKEQIEDFWHVATMSTSCVICMRSVDLLLYAVICTATPCSKSCRWPDGYLAICYAHVSRVGEWRLCHSQLALAISFFFPFLLLSVYYRERSSRCAFTIGTNGKPTSFLLEVALMQLLAFTFLLLESSTYIHKIRFIILPFSGVIGAFIT